MVYYQNVRGLRTKLFDLRSALATVSADYDVIIFVETWLISGINDAELGMDNFNVFRCDRNVNTSNLSRGGGVLIAIRKCFFSRILRVSVTDVEHLFVEIRLGFESLLIGAVYLPPGSDPFIFSRYCCAVEEVFTSLPNSFVLLTGDFNLPSVSWGSAEDGTLIYYAQHGCVCAQADLLCEYFNLFSLTQHCSILNAYGRSLDLVFSNFDYICIMSAEESLLTTNPYHLALSFSLPIWTCSSPLH